MTEDRAEKLVGESQQLRQLLQEAEALIARAKQIVAEMDCVTSKPMHRRRSQDRKPHAPPDARR